MNRSLKIAVLIIVVATGSWSLGVAGEPTTFERILPEYESIRLALLHDGLDDVAEAARNIHSLSQKLEGKFNEQEAGIQPEAAEELKALLLPISDASHELSGAETIAEARESFGALSKALVEYRRLAENPTSVVAFCPMTKKVWLQPSGEIGNPYYGQSMASCGEFVSQ